MLKAAARTFSITPRENAATTSRVGATARKIASPIETTVTLLEIGDDRVCLINSHFVIEMCPYSNLRRRKVAQALGIRPDRVLAFASHNHSDVLIGKDLCRHGFPQLDAEMDEADLTDEGREAVAAAVDAASRLPGELVPVEVWWGMGHERRITYNRKGRRADGSTYLMREEDRILVAADYNGDIDDDAPLVALKDKSGTPVCFLVQFTGHPATAYHPEDPVVFGEYAQVACDELSAAFGRVPVAFFQGCAGEINSKGLIVNKPASERVEDATRYGKWLGAAYLAAARDLTRSSSRDLDLTWERIRLPFRRVPSEAALRRMICEVDAFRERCARDDWSAWSCLGINVPRAFTPRYRMELIMPTRRWAEWALSFHTERRLDEAPRFVEVDVAVLRIGDVAFAGMFGEPFLGIGRQIKRDSPFALTIPCGYMNDEAMAYIPDSANNGDWDYQSSFFRYTTSLLPYRQPAGDLLARAAVRNMHKTLARGERPE